MLCRSAIAVTVSLAIFGCGGSPTAPSDSSSSSSSTTPGTLNVRITDSPYGSAKAVLVTFSEVMAYRDSNGTRMPFADGSTSTWTCDLKKLQNGAQDLLASGRPNTGTYTMVKVVVQSAKIFFDNSAVSATPCARSIPEPAGASFPLALAAREVSLNGSFGLNSNAPTTILIDFDGESSIRQNGSTYTMDPVLRVVSVQ
jgi:hypothetical protein